MRRCAAGWRATNHGPARLGAAVSWGLPSAASERHGAASSGHACNSPVNGPPPCAHIAHWGHLQPGVYAVGGRLHGQLDLAVADSPKVFAQVSPPLVGAADARAELPPKGGRRVGWVTGLLDANGSSGDPMGPGEEGEGAPAAKRRSWSAGNTCERRCRDPGRSLAPNAQACTLPQLPPACTG